MGEHAIFPSANNLCGVPPADHHKSHWDDFRSTRYSKWSHPFSFDGPIHEVVHRCGYDHFLMAYLPHAGDFLLENQLIKTSYSPEMIRKVNHSLLAGHSAIFVQLRNTIVPRIFRSDNQSDELSEVQPDISKISEDRQFLSQVNADFGCCVPLPMLGGERAFAMLTGAGSLPLTSIGDTAHALLEVFEPLSANLRSSVQRRAATHLNPREIECLKWAAAGKTSCEIAVITGLSEHTINHYLNLCCRKLDAVNRVQAVAKAIRNHII